VGYDSRVPVSLEPPALHVTVAVPVLNRLDRMLRCLDAVLALDYRPYDVLVLDNGSTDGTLEACVDRAEGTGIALSVKLVEGQIGRLRNVAARSAAGEIIAFTDSDCLPTPGWLTAGVGPFADPNVGVVTGPTLPEVAPHGAWCATQEIGAQTWRFETCNALYRREALLASEGFDETVSMWEDAAAGWSVMRNGWSAAFAADAVVHHDVTYPGWSWHMRRATRYGEVARVVKRFPEMADRLLWHRYFLRPTDAKFAAFLAGVLLARGNRAALVLTLPYAQIRRPGALSASAVRDTIELTLFDAAIFAGMMRGSWRGRRLLI
jgi:cellulose synthase/poly-beta-1,6-N-acetylglucosamine synthase-like glycosyltransferase